MVPFLCVPKTDRNAVRLSTAVKITICCLVVVFVGLSPVVQAQSKIKGADQAKLKTSRTRAIQFLLDSQLDDGSWTTANAPGISALITTSLVRSGLTADHPSIQKAIQHLKSHVKPDGGIYWTESNHRNYETCISMMAFAAVNKDKRHDKLLAAATKFLREIQWDKGEGLESTDDKFGGFGYGSHRRPDMSNTQFAIEALRTIGKASAQDEAIQNALLFVNRAQNLESEFNNTPNVSKVNDGGSLYTPANGGESKAGANPDGGLRSYGSMTYAGLKSMVYAGVKKDDKRIKAAYGWIQKHYTLDSNPGMGQQGLFYYYHTFAKALTVFEVDELEDGAGKKHDWRRELSERLFSVQRENGSWVNRADRWYEGNPDLSTAYALLALSYCDNVKTKK